MAISGMTMQISIHAPARGATFNPLDGNGCKNISIHAPARGATLSWAYGNADDFISIHAPARGATVAQAPNQCYHSYFNPRSREGSDKRRRSSQASRIRFQSTLPRGERQEKAQLCTDATTISIHAPARGATDRAPVRPAAFGISIHAPARGATGCSNQRPGIWTISIHAPARGATVLAPVAPAQKQKFQSTLPRGERLNRLVLVDTFVDISIHAPARGATQFRELPQIDVQFQSTLPRGERPCVYSSTLSARHFNPRSREGSDR